MTVLLLSSVNFVSGMRTLLPITTINMTKINTKWHLMDFICKIPVPVIAHHSYKRGQNDY